MHKFRYLVLASVLLAAVAISTAFAGKPAPPPLPPCDGAPIEVLNDDVCGKSMWIEVTDSTTVCDIICRFVRTKKQTCPVIISWIGGRVVADPSAEHGFYFEPGTVRVAEVTAEGMQTTTCAISDNPGFFDGGTWYVEAWLSEYRDL